MTLLDQYKSQGGSTDEAVAAYVQDVGVRYDGNQESPDAATQVECQWLIYYQTKSTVMSSVLALPLLLVGHMSFFYEKVNFTTYHFLDRAEVRKLKAGLVVRGVLLPLLAFAVVLSAVLLVILLFTWLGMIFYAITEPTPQTAGGFLTIGIITLMAVAVFTAIRWVQVFLQRMGRPPNAPDLTDEAVKLLKVKVL